MHDGPPNIKGSLIWDPGKAPLFGSRETPTDKSKTDHDYELKLVQQGDTLTGVFNGRGIYGRYYQGEIFLSNPRGKLEGRYSMRVLNTTYSTQIVHGVLGKKEAHIFFGMPKEDKKYSNQLRVRITDQDVSWQASRGKLQNVFISDSGHLKLSQNQLTGSIGSYRTTENIDVQVTEQNTQPELAWIATLLCCSEILRMQ